MKIIVFILSLFASIHAFACQCISRVSAEKSNIELAIEDYTWIAIVEVTKVDSTIYPLKYDFLVKTLYQGDSEVKQMESGIGGGDCGFRFKAKQTYLVYGHKELETIHVTYCSRTQHITKTADKDYLDKHFKNPDFEFHWSKSFTNFVQLKTKQQIDTINPPIIVKDYACIDIQQLIEVHPNYWELEIIKLNSGELKQVNPEHRDKIIKGGILVVKHSYDKTRKGKLIRKINKNCI